MNHHLKLLTMQTIKFFPFLFACGALLLTYTSCNKQTAEGELYKGQYTVSYGDSILYKTGKATDNIIFPAGRRCGKFSSFPQGLQIDERTGAINIAASEAGLRYRIDYTSPAGEVSSSFVIVSGINYVDAYFKLYGTDSIIAPVYNADAARAMPAASFDMDGSARAKGCAIDTKTGKINLRQTARNGFFGTPQNGYKKEVEIKYRINDGSQDAPQSISVLLYYYNSLSDVPADVVQTINDHWQQVLYTTTSGSISEARAAAISKPRPPCVVIIAH